MSKALKKMVIESKDPNPEEVTWCSCCGETLIETPAECEMCIPIGKSGSVRVCQVKLCQSCAKAMAANYRSTKQCEVEIWSRGILRLLGAATGELEAMSNQLVDDRPPGPGNSRDLAKWVSEIKKDVESVQKIVLGLDTC